MPSEILIFFVNLVKPIDLFIPSKTAGKYILIQKGCEVVALIIERLQDFENINKYRV